MKLTWKAFRANKEWYFFVFVFEQCFSLGRYSSFPLKLETSSMVPKEDKSQNIEYFRNVRAVLFKLGACNMR